MTESVLLTMLVLAVIWRLKTHATARAVRRQQVIDQLNQVVHEIEVETIGDVAYWYDVHSMQFIAQGRTREEIVDHLKSKFLKHMFLIENKLLVGPDFVEVDVHYINQAKS